MGERKQGIRWATDTFGHISHLTLVQCLALLESDAKFDASFPLHILYIRICWETWELKAACSCLKPKKNDFIQFHSSAKWMLHDTCDSEAGWTFHWLNIASPFPSRFRAFHEFIWSIINSMTPYDQWIHMRNWNWEADQGCKPWSHLLHAFELLPKGCHVASALKHMFHWVVCWVPIWVHRKMHQSNKESLKTFQDYALCSLNRITVMRYV